MIVDKVSLEFSYGLVPIGYSNIFCLPLIVECAFRSEYKNHSFNQQFYL